MNRSLKLKPLLSILAIFLCFLGKAAFSLSLGLVDLQKALQSVDAGKTAKSQLEKEVTGKRAELEKLQQKLQEEAEQFEKKAAILSDSAKASKQAELQKKIAEFQKNAAESQVDLQKKERELTKPILDELRSIIEGIGKERDLDLVLERNEGAVLYSKSSVDLTDDAVSRFNSKHKGKSKKK